MLMFAVCPRPIESMTFATRPPIIATPCNKVCTIDESSELCIGCGRSRAEIAAWLGYSDAERARLMAELPQRLAALRGARPRCAGPS